MRTYLTTVLCLSTLALAVPVQAAETPSFFFKPYVGADYQYIAVNYENNVFGTGVDGDNLANDSIHGANLHLGARIHKHFGFEAGYLWTGDASKSNVLGSGLDSEVSVKGFNLDALGYLPIDDAERLELVGTVGISHLEAEYNIPTVGSVDDNETKPRFGAGLQYRLTDHVNVRGLVRYQGADFGGSVENAITGNLGLNLQF